MCWSADMSGGAAPSGVDATESHRNWWSAGNSSQEQPQAGCSFQLSACNLVLKTKSTKPVQLTVSCLPLSVLDES